MLPIFDTLFANNTTELNTAIWTVVGIIWIYCVLWTARDIYARSDNSLFQIFCVLLVMIASPLI